MYVSTVSACNARTISQIGAIEVGTKLAELKFWNIHSVKNCFTDVHHRKSYDLRGPVVISGFWKCKTSIL